MLPTMSELISRIEKEFESSPGIKTLETEENYVVRVDTGDVPKENLTARVESGYLEVVGESESAKIYAKTFLPDGLNIGSARAKYIENSVEITISKVDYQSPCE